MRKTNYQKTFLGLTLAATLSASPVWAQESGPQGPPPPPPYDQQAPPPYQQAPPPSRQTPQSGGWHRFDERPQTAQDQRGYDPRGNDPRDNDPRGYDQGGYDPQNPQQPPMDRQSQGARPYPGPRNSYTPNLPPELTIPDGTWITVRVNQPLSSDHNQPGDSWTGSLVQPLVVNGFVVARRGQTLAGRVVDVQKAGHVKGVSRLGIEITELTLASGQQVPVKTQLVERKGNTSVGQDVGTIGVTTGIGAAIGAAAGGGFGAGLGAIAGAGASTIGVLATRGRPTVVYPETPITFRMQSSVTFPTEGAYEAFVPVGQQDYDQRGPQRSYGAYGRPSGPPPAYYGYASPYPYYGGPYYSPYYWGPSFSFYGGPGYFRGSFGGAYFGGRYYGHRR